MDIDQRIEALTQSVELMAQMQRDAEAATEKRFAQIAQIFEATHDSIVRLERIAVAHEDRLDDLENRG